MEPTGIEPATSGLQSRGERIQKTRLTRENRGRTRFSFSAKPPFLLCFRSFRIQKHIQTPGNNQEEIRIR